MRLMRAFAVAPVAIGLLANAASASADTVVGQIAPPTIACTPGTLYQAATATPPSYATPHGVITSWTVQTDANVAPIKLKVLHAVGGGQYSIVGESTATTPSASSTQTFASRIPVGTGDYLGMSVLSGSADCRFSTANYADAVRESSTVDPPVGSTITVSTSHPNSRLDVRSVVEPDKDSDGFGDTTQDACPTDPTTQSLCTADLSIEAASIFQTPRVGHTITWSVTVRNHSPYNRATANVRWALPGWVRIDSVTSTSPASCRFFYSRSSHESVTICRHTYGPSGVVNFHINSRPLTGGTIVAHGSLTRLDTVDPDLSNNSTTARRFIYGAGAACVSLLDGTSFDDRLIGTRAGDRTHGFGGDDRIEGKAGDDCLYGGRGNDLIIGGSGHDRIYGGAGDDVIHAEDGHRDVVRCGAGYDKVYADRIDSVARNCEQVVRS